MNETKPPEGWDGERLRRVLAHYEHQSEDEALIEDEAEMEPSDTVMSIPRDLVPEIRELIAKRHG